MPFRSTISFAHQQWIVCALCSCTFLFISFKALCIWMIRIIMMTVSRDKVVPAGDCPFPYSINSWEKRELPFYLPELYWFPRTMESGDNAVLLGMILVAVPAGILSDLGYTKYVLGGGLLLVAVSYFLTPAFVNSETMFLLLSVSEGTGDGSIIPAVISLISTFPPSERNTFTAFIVSGFFLGRAAGPELFTLVYPSWSFGHHAIGAFALVLAALCFVFVYSSSVESSVVLQCGTISHQSRSLSDLIQGTKGIPGLKTITSPRFLSLVLVYCSISWAVIENVFEHRYAYQKYVLHLPVNDSGRVAEAIIVIPSLLIGGLLADWILKQGLASKTEITRMFVFVSVVCPSLFLAAAFFLAGCSVPLFWALSITGVYTLGLGLPVLFPTLADLNPQHSGLQMGIMTVARNICALFNPDIGRWLIPNPYNPCPYRKKFLFFTLVAFALMIPFMFFGTGETSHARRQASDIQVLSDMSIEPATLDKSKSRTKN